MTDKISLPAPDRQTTRQAIMLSAGTPQRGSAGTGRRARLRTACRKAWGFESPLPHFLKHCSPLTLVPAVRKYLSRPAYISHRPSYRNTAIVSETVPERLTYKQNRTTIPSSAPPRAAEAASAGFPLKQLLEILSPSSQPLLHLIAMLLAPTLYMPVAQREVPL